MKKLTKNYYFGIFVGFFLALTLVTAPILATGGATSLQVVLNTVNIMLDGTVIGSEGSNYTLSNGSSVPLSILYNGTTYLPVRKLSELLGKDVNYIPETKTVVLGEMPVASVPGWYLIKEAYVPSESDFNIAGAFITYNTNNDKISDTYEASGSGHTYLITHSRRIDSASGTFVTYSGTANVNFSAAPPVMLPDNKYSMTLSHSKVEGDWGFAQANISFSTIERIGYGGFGDTAFVDASGNGFYLDQSGTVTTSKDITQGKEGDIKYLKVSLSNGYGYVYTYQWKN
jgi:hypothetical protein